MVACDSSWDLSVARSFVVVIGVVVLLVMVSWVGVLGGSSALLVMAVGWEAWLVGFGFWDFLLASVYLLTVLFESTYEIRYLTGRDVLLVWCGQGGMWLRR